MFRRRKIKSWLLVFCTALVALTGPYSFPSVLSAKPGVSDKGEKKALKLVAEYKQNILQDLSSDGQLMLFYQTSTPMRTYSYQSDTGKVKPDQPEVYDDLLRVVEIRSGRELGRIKTEFFPENVQFLPGTNQVFYKEPKRKPDMVWHLNLWNFSTGQAEVCSNEDAIAFRFLTLLDQRHGLGVAMQKDGGDLLATLSLPNCTKTILGPVDPAYPEGRIGGGLALSPDKHSLVYSIYVSNKAVIWNTDNMRITKTLDYSPLYFGSNAAFTPDGKLLLVDAHTHPFGGEGAKDFLLFYDTKTYQVVRRLDLPRISAIAVSPDSRTLAIAYKKEERKTLSTDEQGFIVLYDLVTGEELATASHPALKQRRSDPFAAMINRLAFTPDGKYLLSSAYDTRVWRID